MDDLSMQGYLGNQIGNSQYNTTMQAQMMQNAGMLGQFQQQEQQRKAVQPQKPTDDHLLVLLTED